MIVQSIMFYHKFMSGYYPFNLQHTAYLTFFRLGQAYLNPNTYSEIQHLFAKYTHKPALLSHNPWFNGIYMGVGGYVISSNKLTDPHLLQLHQDLIDFWDCPNTEFHLDDRTNYTLDPFVKRLKWLIDVLTWLRSHFAWLDILKKITPQLISAKAFPIREQCSNGFLFQRNPFKIYACGVDNKKHSHSGTDILAAYWLARYYNFISPND